VKQFLFDTNILIYYSAAVIVKPEEGIRKTVAWMKEYYPIGK